MFTLEWVSCSARKFWIRQLMVYSIYPMKTKLTKLCFFFKSGDIVPLNFRKSVWLCVRRGEGGPAEGTKRHCSRQGGHGSQGIDQEWAGCHCNVVVSVSVFPHISPIFMDAVRNHRNHQFNLETLHCRDTFCYWLLPT